MSNKEIKQSTKIYFEVVGFITPQDDKISINQKSKKANSNYVYSRLPLQIKVGEQKHYISIMGGNSPSNKIFAKYIDGDMAEISFENRWDKGICDKIHDMSFYKIGTEKVKALVINENGKEEEKLEWKFNKYLSELDFVNALIEIFKKDMRVRMTGEVILNEYEGKIQKQFKVKRVYILNDNEIPECFKLKVETLVDEHSLDESGVEECGNGQCKSKIKTKIYHRVNANQREIFPMDIYYYTNKEEKDKINKMHNIVFKVPNGKVRKVSLECELYNGKIYKETQTDEMDLEEKQALIELGLYDENSEFKYADVQYIEEIRLINIRQMKKGETLLLFDDNLYNKDDLIDDIIPDDQIFPEDDLPF